jgi:hypothetical protein
MGHTAPKDKGSIQYGRGDIFGQLPVGSDGNILVADSSGPSGVNWSSSAIAVAAGAGLSGFWIYGDGSDGNVTLVAPTTLAAGDSVKNYNNLNLGGFLLIYNVADFYGVIYVKDTLSGMGGSIAAIGRGSGTFNLGGSGGGVGGNGGFGAGAIYVFARNITTGLIVGAEGTEGASALSSGGFPLIPGSDSEYASNIVFKSKSYPSPPAPVGIQGGFHFGPGPGSGGAGGGCSVPATNRLEITRTATDFIRMVIMNGFSSYSIAGPGPDERWARSNGGGGGASGQSAGPGGVVVVAAGGGGGGGSGIIGNGGSGGGASAVEVDLSPDLTIDTGAGGGGGAGGGLAILVCDTVTAAVIVLARGGFGGGGSDGAGIPGAPAGGAGGGGGGGYALGVVRSGAGFVTANADGGAGGVGFGASGAGGAAGFAAVLVSA